MGEAAVSAAQAVNYVNAGTVEFIAGPDGGFYFLEMNTRLQVEHPVTEMTTGLDLVREQILIANGEPLSMKASDLRQTGHAIECRIYAEVPEENFRPDVGKVEIFGPPSGPGIRLDTGIQQGSEVSFHYDPMLAKLIVWASSRNTAIDRMRRALSEFVLLGVRNNIEFLHRVISHPEFCEGKIDTHFIERHPELLHALDAAPPVAALLAASLNAGQVGRTRTSAAEAAGFSDVWASGPWRIS
jgi:acetyl/propionyl-CoA carboxylase alpha subunit